MQLIQVLHCEGIQFLICFLLNEGLELFLSVLALLNFCLQQLFQTLDFLEDPRILLNIAVSLLLRFLDNLGLNREVVIFQVFEIMLQLFRAFFCHCL